MNYQYLLDTNIISNLVKNPQGIVFQHILSVGEESICTSIIIAYELTFGAKKRNSPALTQQLTTILEIIPILPFHTPVNQIYGDIRTTLERSGTLIGPMDMLIAAHAMSLNLTLVTDNTREFMRVPNFSLENWLE